MELGRRFHSFLELEEFLMKFSEKESVNFYKRDSRTIGAAKKKYQQKDFSQVNAELKYYEAKYACVHGGKTFKSAGKGIRSKPTFRKGCPAHISLKMSDDGRALEVIDVCNDHNHKVSKVIIT